MPRSEKINSEIIVYNSLPKGVTKLTVETRYHYHPNGKKIRTVWFITPWLTKKNIQCNFAQSSITRRSIDMLIEGLQHRSMTTIDLAYEILRGELRLKRAKLVNEIPD